MNQNNSNISWQQDARSYNRHGIPLPSGFPARLMRSDPDRRREPLPSAPLSILPNHTVAPITCPQCTIYYVFENEARLEEHRRNFHSSHAAASIPRAPTLLDASISWTCKECGLNNLPDRLTLLDHMRTHKQLDSNNAIKCQALGCGRSYTTHEQLREHTINWMKASRDVPPTNLQP